MGQFEIRREQESDHARVDEIQKAAFGQDGEARLVEKLREQARPYLSLVAVRSDELVGHVFLSPVTIEGANPPQPSKEGPTFAGLAPLAVMPDVLSGCRGWVRYHEAFQDV